RGRIVMVERSVNEPDPELTAAGRPMPITTPDSRDWKLTLLSRGHLQVVRLSKVGSITLHDGDLAMQLHRSLDASAGEGMFEQVDIEIRLVDARSHRLEVSYVVGAPMWKPTYRVVLPKDGKGEALLQGWAVVDNVSGEDWNEVRLSLTSGAPISFRYDLHTPREVHRSDMTRSAADKRAAVGLGVTTWGQEELYDEEMNMPAPEPEPAAAPGGGSGYRGADKSYDFGDDMAEAEYAPRDSKPASKPAPASPSRRSKAAEAS